MKVHLSSGGPKVRALDTPDDAVPIVKSRRILVASDNAPVVTPIQPGHVFKQEGKSVTGRDRIQDYSTEALCAQCHEETARFRRGEPSDDSFCFEVFRRAVVEGVDACWQGLHSIYHDQISSWCRRAGAKSQQEVEDAVVETWAKFFEHFGPPQFLQAHSTASIQRYLKTVAWTVIADIGRAEKAKARLVSLDRPSSPESTSPLGDSLADASPTPEEHFADQTVREAFWEMIRGEARSEQEQVIVELKYELGLKSREVQAKRSDLFPTVNDVYQADRRILERLERRPQLRHWFGKGDG